MYYVKLINKRRIGYVLKTISINKSIEECEQYILKNCSKENDYVIMDINFNTIKKMKGGNDYEV